MVARSWACAARRSSARPRRARRRSSFTTSSSSEACETNRQILLVMPFSTPVPPSPDTSAALLEAFAERGIQFVLGRKVAALDSGARGSGPLRTGPSFRSTSSSVFPSTVRPTPSSRAGWPRTGTSRSTRANARDPLSGRLCGRRRHDGGRAEGGRLRGGCRARGGSIDPLAARARRGAGRV